MSAAVECRAVPHLAHAARAVARIAVERCLIISASKSGSAAQMARALTQPRGRAARAAAHAAVTSAAEVRLVPLCKNKTFFEQS